MLDLKGFKGFAVIKNDMSKEHKSLLVLSMLQNIPIIKVADKGQKCPEGYVPCGSVEWCFHTLGGVVPPDYYPEWLTRYLYRKVWRSDTWPLGQKVFVKPADRDKRFIAFVTNGGYRKKKKPPIWCSEVVSFENEWRYYISQGNVVCGEWYWGDEINTPKAPSLDVEIPKGYCGAVDFGVLATGEFALVEANLPFACGWYGVEHEKYFQWLIDGWAYMLEKREGQHGGL